MPTTESSPGGSEPSCERQRFAQNICKRTKHLLLPQKPHTKLGAGPTAPTAAPALLPPAARAAPAGLDPREWLSSQPLTCRDPGRGVWGGNSGLSASSAAQPCSELQQQQQRCANHPHKNHSHRAAAFPSLCWQINHSPGSWQEWRAQPLLHPNLWNFGFVITPRLAGVLM